MKPLVAAVVVLVTLAVAVVLIGSNPSEVSAQDSDWRQWGGPDRNFVSDSTGLADSWSDSGPPVLWSRPLGLGHSSIAVDDGWLYTLYRRGAANSRNWESREFVVALDAETGETLWEYEYVAEPLNFGRGAGPHATPLVVGDLVFAAGTNKQLFAFDKKSGEVVWSHDLVAEFDAPPTLRRPPVKAGYAGSPVAWEDTIILQVGGPGQSVMAFRQSDGEPVWSSGDFLVAQAAPLVIDVDGEAQVVIFGGQTVNGLRPSTGEILWSHGHDTSSDMNNSMPIWGADNILFISSAYNMGSRGLRLSRAGSATVVEELWFTNRLGLMFSNAIRLGDLVYGTDGNSGPGFLTALDVRTGESVWESRGFGRSSLLHADGKTIILDEDGDLSLLRLSPEGMEILAQTHIFDTTSWTVPALVGTTLYARDREKIVALDLGVR